MAGCRCMDKLDVQLLYKILYFKNAIISPAAWFVISIFVLYFSSAFILRCTVILFRPHSQQGIERRNLYSKALLWERNIHWLLNLKTSNNHWNCFTIIIMLLYVYGWSFFGLRFGLLFCLFMQWDLSFSRVEGDSIYKITRFTMREWWRIWVVEDGVVMHEHLNNGFCLVHESRWKS